MIDTDPSMSTERLAEVNRARHIAAVDRLRQFRRFHTLIQALLLGLMVTLLGLGLSGDCLAEINLLLAGLLAGVVVYSALMLRNAPRDDKDVDPTPAPHDG